MDADRIAELLQPFLRARELPAPATLSPDQLKLISIYVDLLLRWGARINLTAVRNAEDIVTRHFGESLFLAAYLFPSPSNSKSATQDAARPHVLDFGSGAGFPGLPLKIYAPELRLTVVESNRKKAAFLAEAIRALRFSDASVFAGRFELGMLTAQDGPPPGLEPSDVVTMRAVERFAWALETAAAIARSGAAQFGAGKLALLIGSAQAAQTQQLVPDFRWEPPIPVPRSRQR